MRQDLPSLHPFMLHLSTRSTRRRFHKMIRYECTRDLFPLLEQHAIFSNPLKYKYHIGVNTVTVTYLGTESLILGIRPSLRQRSISHFNFFFPSAAPFSLASTTQNRSSISIVNTPNTSQHSRASFGGKLWAVVRD